MTNKISMKILTIYWMTLVNNDSKSVNTDFTILIA